MENKRIVYDFCPRCGALMKDGSCMSCGWKKEPEGQQEPCAQQTADRQPATDLGREKPGAEEREKGPAMNAPHKNRKFWIWTCAALSAFLLLLCLALGMIAKDAGTWEVSLQEKLADAWKAAEARIFTPDKKEEMPDRPEPEVSESQEKPREPERFLGPEKDENYVPDPSDEYYVDIVDAVRADLSYQIEWEDYGVESDRADASFHTIYPRITGNLPNQEQLNAYIEQEALFYKDYCEFYVDQAGMASCHIQSIGYVTYMDEDILSIVFEEQLALETEIFPGLFDINIDLKTGTVLEHENMISYTTELSRRFRKQNRAQNGESLTKEELSDEILRQLLEGVDGVVFYTPLGMEIGLNFNGAGNRYGWATITLKDYEKYRKKI